MDKIVYEEWKTKNEEITIKVEANNDRAYDQNYTKTEAKGATPINTMDKMVYEEWKTKSEEITIKVEENYDRSLAEQNQAEIKPKTSDSMATLKKLDLYKDMTIKNEMIINYEEILFPMQSKQQHKRLIVKNFKCAKCDYATSYESGLSRHARTCKNRKRRVIQCDQCEFTTGHKRNLKRHIIKHKNPEEVQKFKCDQCEYATVWKSYLNIHLMKHKNPEEVQKFKCDQCEFATVWKYYFNRHLIKHKNPKEVKKFECGQCAFVTKQNRRFQQHLLFHRNPKEARKFKCEKVRILKCYVLFKE